jgi:hypothetical protein
MHGPIHTMYSSCGCLDESKATTFHNVQYQDQDQIVNSYSAMYEVSEVAPLQPGSCRVSRVACRDRASRAKLLLERRLVSSGASHD